MTHAHLKPEQKKIILSKLQDFAIVLEDNSYGDASSEIGHLIDVIQHEIERMPEW